MSTQAKRRANGEGTITRRKDGRWEGKTRPYRDAQGQMRRKAVYGKSRAEVAQKLREAHNDVANGYTFDGDRLTLGEFTQEWLQLKKSDCKDSTLRTYGYSLRHAASVNHIPIARVDARTIAGLYRRLGEDGKSDATRQKLHTHLVMVFRTAQRFDLLKKDPMLGVSRPKAPKKAIDVWSDRDLVTFLDAIPQNTTAYPLFYTLASTGMRRGEVLGLHWDDLRVDTDGTGTLRVRRQVVAAKGKGYEVTTPKTKASSRTIAIAPDLVAILQALQQRVAAHRGELGLAWSDSSPVFPSEKGTYLDPKNITRMRKRWIAASGAPYLTTHGLRHTHASLLIARGIDAKTVSERLGHTSVQFTTNTYQKTYEWQRRNAAVGIQDLIAHVAGDGVQSQDSGEAARFMGNQGVRN